jgi:hypothetical protein
MAETGIDTRGAAIVGMSIGIALLSALAKKGIFTEHDVETFLEGILESLETLEEVNDPGVQGAHKIVEGMAYAILEARHQP